MFSEPVFTWPNNAEVGLSITFDDARTSQLDAAIPVLDAFGIKATFFVMPQPLEQRADDWRAALAAGHEIGNHTVTHPCTRNFSFIGKNALEAYSLDDMEWEMLHCNERIVQCCGVNPTVFAYPCGQTYIGWGAHTRSYVPLVSKHFAAARGFPGERHNLPARCNLDQVFGCPFDGLPFEAVLAMINTAREERGWLVLVGHDVGDGQQRQTVDEKTLRMLCQYAADARNRVYTGTFGVVGIEIHHWQVEQRRKKHALEYQHRKRKKGI